MWAWLKRRSGGPPRRVNAQHVVVVGQGRARITSITATAIGYRDEHGKDSVVDLEACNRRWTSHQERAIERGDILMLDGSEPRITDEDRRRVGSRDLLGDRPWVRVLDERRTVFVFASYEAAYELLLDPLGQHGWDTFDCG